jgi:hypothetical protein
LRVEYESSAAPVAHPRLAEEDLLAAVCTLGPSRGRRRRRVHRKRRRVVVRARGCRDGPRVVVSLPRRRTRWHRRRECIDGHRRRSVASSPGYPAALHAGRRRRMYADDGALVRRGRELGGTGSFAPPGSLGRRGTSRIPRAFSPRSRRPASLLAAPAIDPVFVDLRCRGSRRRRCRSGFGFREHALDLQGSEDSVCVRDGPHAQRRGGCVREFGERDTLVRNRPDGLEMLQEFRVRVQGRGISVRSRITLRGPLLIVAAALSILLRVGPRSPAGI